MRRRNRDAARDLTDEEQEQLLEMLDYWQRGKVIFGFVVTVGATAAAVAAWLGPDRIIDWWHGR